MIFLQFLREHSLRSLSHERSPELVQRCPWSGPTTYGLPLPTIDDVLPLLSKARVFTVLDAKNGFWHIQLDEPSSLASTFATPWGKISLAANAVWIVSSSGGISEAN